MPTIRSSKSPLVSGNDDTGYNTGYRLYWQQFVALFMKRWHHGKRDKKGVFAQVGNYLRVSFLFRIEEPTVYFTFSFLLAVCPQLFTI